MVSPFSSSSSPSHPLTFFPSCHLDCTLGSSEELGKVGVEAGSPGKFGALQCLRVHYGG